MAADYRLVGTDAVFLRVLDRLRSIAAHTATVVVEGETGTGKELAARAIHTLSSRASAPFVAVNCGALPDSLVEAELFGHTRGAFTDAKADRHGLLRVAHGGTLCLDEIGSLSPKGQATLLRVLQDKTFRALGSTSEQKVDIRFVALTNVPLWDLVTKGMFRGDLYYRLCVLSVRLPALRERRGDIIPLAHYFLSKYARADCPVTAIAPDVQALLESHDWPGNIRQLEHAILSAAQLAPTTRLELSDIELPGGTPADHPHAGAEISFAALKRQAIEGFERRYLTTLMEQCRGNVTRAARLAQKERRDMGRMLKKYRIEPRRFVG